MGKHFKTNPLAIQLCDIDGLIAALVALRLKPERDGQAWLRTLRSMDAIVGNDALTVEIDTAEHDCECLVCGSHSCGCDARYDDFALAPVRHLGVGRIAA